MSMAQRSHGALETAIKMYTDVLITDGLFTKERQNSLIDYVRRKFCGNDIKSVEHAFFTTITNATTPMTKARLHYQLSHVDDASLDVLFAELMKVCAAVWFDGSCTVFLCSDGYQRLQGHDPGVSSRVPGGVTAGAFRGVPVVLGTSSGAFLGASPGAFLGAGVSSGAFAVVRSTAPVLPRTISRTISRWANHEAQKGRGGFGVVFFVIARSSCSTQQASSSPSSSPSRIHAPPLAVASPTCSPSVPGTVRFPEEGSGALGATQRPWAYTRLLDWKRQDQNRRHCSTHEWFESDCGHAQVAGEQLQGHAQA